MGCIQIPVLVWLCLFYLAYLVKAMTLKKKGITVALLGKGEKPRRALAVEVILRFATLLGAIIQFASSIFPDIVWSVPVGLPIRLFGLVLLAAGNLAFISAMVTMRDNWRAGFEQNQNTSLVTNGIYRFSRNPAFLGFDLLYVGCAMVLPNIVNIVAAVACLCLFHLQVLAEEQFCAEVFGKEYTDYQARVRRYI